MSYGEADGSIVTQVEKLAAELPPPLDQLVLRALHASHGLERQHRIALTCEQLCKWFVAVELAGKRLEDWPRKIKTVFNRQRNVLRPTLGVWVSWASLAGSFSADPLARTSMDDVRQMRNQWAHFDEFSRSGETHQPVGEAVWWQRLLSGPACRSLRAGNVRASLDSPWPDWEHDGGRCGSLYPWVVSDGSSTMLLHHIRWRHGSAAYASYDGTTREYPLNLSGDDEYATAATDSPVLRTRTAQALGSFFRAQRACGVLIGDGTSAAARMAAAMTRPDVRVFVANRLSDVKRVVREVSTAGTRCLVVASDSHVANSLRQWLPEAVAIRMQPPTDVEVMAEVAFYCHMPLDEVDIRAALTGVAGQSDRLLDLVERLHKRRPESKRELRSLCLNLKTRDLPGANLRLHSCIELKEHLDNFDGAAATELESLLARVGPAAQVPQATMVMLEETLPSFVHALSIRAFSGPVDVAWGAWLRRWVGNELGGVIAAAQAMLAVESERCVDAAVWLSLIRQNPHSETGRYSAGASAFVAAVLSRCVVAGVQQASAAETLQVLTLEALSWLRHGDAGAHLNKPALQRSACTGFNRDKATGRADIIAYLLGEGPFGEWWDAKLRCVEDDWIGAAASALVRNNNSADVACWADVLGRAVSMLELQVDTIAAETHKPMCTVPASFSAAAGSAHAHEACRVAIRALDYYGLSTTEGARWYASAQDFLNAEQNWFWRGERLQELSEVVARAGEYSDALELARRIDFGIFRIVALLNVAVYHDDPMVSGDLFGEALDEPWRRMHILGDAARARLRLSAPTQGQAERAAAMWASLGAHRECADLFFTLKDSHHLPVELRRWAELQHALHPGVLRMPDAAISPPVLPDSAEGGRRLKCRRGRARLSVNEWQRLRHGVAIEARLSPAAAADWQGVVSSEVGGTTPSYFSLRLAGSRPIVAVETTLGLFEASAGEDLAPLGPEQTPYLLRAGYDGSAIWLEIGGRVVATHAARGLVRLRAGSISICEQQPGMRPLRGNLHGYRVWGRSERGWTCVLDADNNDQL